MFIIKIYIKESYINFYDTSIQMCGQYLILAPTHALIHLLISLGVSINYKSSKRIEISQLGQGIFHF